MDINDFLEYYKTKLLGKLYCHEESVPDDYHYKNMDKGCDHIREGSGGRFMEKDC